MLIKQFYFHNPWADIHSKVCLYYSTSQMNLMIDLRIKTCLCKGKIPERSLSFALSSLGLVFPSPLWLLLCLLCRSLHLHLASECGETGHLAWRPVLLATWCLMRASPSPGPRWEFMLSGWLSSFCLQCWVLLGCRPVSNGLPAVSPQMPRSPWSHHDQSPAVTITAIHSDPWRTETEELF